MDLFEVLKFVHVFAAASWVGAVVVSQVHIAWVKKRDNPPDFLHFIELQAWLGQRYFMPLAITVIVTGLIMVGIGFPDLTDAWILIGLGLFVATVALGAGYLGPQSTKIMAALAQGGPPDAETQARIRRVAVASNADFGLLVLVVADMVFKPGL
ncbi:MAG: DUF2269 family protein [Actinomycetota bacterium]|nr:DUF2269 family protein [Actinomycetota bacterium]